MEQRIDRLEEASARHESQISSLFGKIDDTNKSLAAIQNTLNQIRWMCLGAVAYYVFVEFGFLKALRFVG
jgi:prefoldin subunit 5